MVMRKEIISF